MTPAQRSAYLIKLERAFKTIPITKKEVNSHVNHGYVVGQNAPDFVPPERPPEANFPIPPVV